MGIQIGTRLIPWYGIFIAIGVAAGAILAYFLIRMKHMKFDDFIELACFAGLGGVIGAKLLYIIVSWSQIDFSRITEPAYLNGLMNGGFVFYGGLAGGLLGAFLAGKFLHIPVADYVRTAIPAVPLAHAFGRIGCAFVGCCYGFPYDGPGAVVYTESLFAPLDIPLFPVQAVEAAAELIIAAGLTVWICRNRNRQVRSIELYLILYAAVRFILEFFRYDDSERGILLGLSTSQWISIAVLICAAVSAALYRDRQLPDNEEK